MHAKGTTVGSKSWDCAGRGAIGLGSKMTRTLTALNRACLQSYWGTSKADSSLQEGPERADLNGGQDDQREAQACCAQTEEAADGHHELHAAYKQSDPSQALTTCEEQHWLHEKRLACH